MFYPNFRVFKIIPFTDILPCIFTSVSPTLDGLVLRLDLCSLFKFPFIQLTFVGLDSTLDSFQVVR